MSSRRGWAALLSATVLVGVTLPVAHAGAVNVATENENARTLTVDLPGPFNGCTYLDRGSNATSDAILDLLLPSAFETEANGTLAGEDGPIASAELTSLNPETVRYTIAPGEKWSNGAPFTGLDLEGWWIKARDLASVTSDGYRDIRTLALSNGGLTVTATFGTPYADWNLLFRDVEAIGEPGGCAIGELARRPSLGPYRVASATAHRIVLRMNPNWPSDTNRYGRLVLVDKTTWPPATDQSYAAYSQAVTHGDVAALVARPYLTSKIATSSQIEEVTFAPHGTASRRIAVRRALSWSIDRQALIDRLFGSVTSLPGVAASAIIAQGQANYPGSAGTALGSQTTSTTTTAPANPATNGLADCRPCALDVLTTAGFTRGPSGWRLGAHPLVVEVAVGPSDLDAATAARVVADWRGIGVDVVEHVEPSEAAAALQAASSRVDAAIFARPTGTSPAETARSWAGPPYPDTYPSGVRLSAVTSLYDQALSIFNPVTAAATYLKIDQLIMSRYWVRPLFTPPSLEAWAQNVSPVASSATVAGFVDQIPTWSLAPATSGS